MSSRESLMWASHTFPFGKGIFVFGEKYLYGVGFSGGACRDEEEVLKVLLKLLKKNCLLSNVPVSLSYLKNLSPISKGTIFQEKVWEALQQIPLGETRSYKDIASTIGQEKGYQSVGQAIGRNPHSFLTPCHRVLKKDGALGGYLWGNEIKSYFLTKEKELHDLDPWVCLERFTAHKKL